MSLSSINTASAMSSTLEAARIQSSSSSLGLTQPEVGSKMDHSPCVAVSFRSLTRPPTDRAAMKHFDRPIRSSGGFGDVAGAEHVAHAGLRAQDAVVREVHVAHGDASAPVDHPGRRREVALLRALEVVD